MTNEVRNRKRGTEESKGDLNIFEWHIADFKEAFKNGSDCRSCTSPVYVGKSFDLPNSFWRIELWTKVKDGEQKHLRLSLVFIRELNAHNPVVSIRSEFSLLDKNQKEVSTQGNETVDEYGAERTFRCGYSTLRENTLQLFHFNKLYLDNDVLRIRIKVWIQNEETNASTPKIKKPHTDHLHKDLNQLLESSQCSDVTILVEDSTLKAHKNILSCRSPVFAAMFQNEMSESLTSTVRIEDFNCKTVKGMLEFIYSGNVENVEDDFMELLKIAEKYQLEELKVACTKTAIVKISVENAIELLILGDLYNAPELKYKAMSFINSNKANPLFSPRNENANFEQFVKEHPKLVFEMYKNVRNKSTEEVTRFITYLNP